MIVGCGAGTIVGTATDVVVGRNTFITVCIGCGDDDETIVVCTVKISAKSKILVP